ncbi:Retrovirus-related Pol polyprotein from transposon RE1 [Vitis vinifera]|uniref:Retrovirus-related Pol polyprotein from transposon RE1 n=1 Tax=Vitis vinifera TaxID=29760 RepID=A0A438K5E3_VITVI|nr:Retrovirus-related Pol polyprotein from transposon RE1 [Vitis vinifera]
MSTGKIHISRHVIFDEIDFPFAKPSTVQPPCHVSPSHYAIPLVILTTPISSLLSSSSSPSSKLVPISDDSVSISFSKVAPIPIVQLSFSHVPPFCHPMTTRAKNGIFKPKIFMSPTETIFHSPCEPNSFKETAKVPEWQQAMHLEFEALMNNKTWVLAPSPFNHNIIGCRWVYKLKYKLDGIVERYKARLVAKGFHQTLGFDYFEIFSPVVKPTTICVVLSLALSENWSIRQLDVHNAFLNGDLSEQVFMTQPPGFVDPFKPNFVCKLTKALYGLKQAPRAWFTKLSSALVKWGFSMSQADTSMFVYYNNSVMLVVLVYVDDIIVTGSSSLLIEQLISSLNSCFALKDLVHLNFFLGIEVLNSGSSLHLSQARYICDLLQRVGLSESKSMTSPMAAGPVLSIADGTRLEDPTLYRSLVGALHYCTITRPDIAYTVYKLCQFMHAPTSTHLQAVKRVLCYPKCSLFYGFSFQPSSFLDLIAYTDADWASCPNDRRSTSGYCIFLEAIWSLGQLLNKSTTYLAANPVLHSRAKHVEIDYYFRGGVGDSCLMPVKAFGVTSLIIDVTASAAFGVFHAFGIHKVEDLKEMGANIRTGLGIRPQGTR